jgi:hypothetical protein
MDGVPQSPGEESGIWCPVLGSFILLGLSVRLMPFPLLLSYPQVCKDQPAMGDLEAPHKDWVDSEVSKSPGGIRSPDPNLITAALSLILQIQNVPSGYESQ